MIDLTTLTAEELTSLQAAVSAEIALRAKASASYRITRDFGLYNARRYSRPWIATVSSWPVGKAPDLDFGRYLGDDEGGVVEIMAHAGEIVRWGQRDNRGNGGSNCWGVVESDGTLRVIDQAEARSIYSGK